MSIVGSLNVAILDSDPVFCDRLSMLLGIFGVRHVDAMQSAKEFADIVRATSCDLAFVEIADGFGDVWAGMDNIRKRGVLVIGVSDDRSGGDWVSAVRRGADTILLKPFYPHLLREMLLHLLESPAARRCRVVQFPAQPQRRRGPD